MFMKIFKILLFLLLCISPFVAAQEKPDSIPAWTQDNSFRTHATMFGIGHLNILDTYLSPQEYTGTQFKLMRENMRMTRLLNNRISVQNIIQGHFAYTKSPTEDSKQLSGMFGWNLTWHYNWSITPALHILLGPGMSINGGFTYNTRNGNNPAQARLSTDLNLSAMAIYKLHFWNRIFTLRYQADMPVVGLMFSPNYGQSYYEIFSLGNYDHNVCFTNPFQAFSINQLLSFDIPIYGATLRIGYLGSIRQNQVNHLKQHDWSNLFIIGYVKHFYLIKNKNYHHSQIARK
jgi:hypothetical protein